MANATVNLSGNLFPGAQCIFFCRLAVWRDLGYLWYGLTDSQSVKSVAGGSMDHAPQTGINELAGRLAGALKEAGLWCATAESCTGGLIAAACTDLPGSSAWFKGGVVAYANSAKEGLLDVDPRHIATHGAVSREVVEAMARGAQRALEVECVMAVSGIAGPDGGTREKPVGLVWLCVAAGEQLAARECVFSGDRAAVRLSAVRAALAALLELLAERKACL